MSIPFANFDQTSPMSTSPHDPMVSLASNCIRDFFGPTVQMVADGLMFRGEPSTLKQLVSTLRDKIGRKVYSQERIRLLGKSVASRLQNQNLQLPPIKASLLVLVQHSIVKVNLVTQKEKLVYTYEMDMKRARILPRYPRYLEYTQRAYDATAASLVEELLVQGRLRTVDTIQKTVERILEQSADNDGDDAAAPDKMATAQTVLDSFKRLAQAGFLQEVPKIIDPTTVKEESEHEFDEQVKEPPTKKIKREEKKEEEDTRELEEPEDEAIVALINGNAYKNILPRHAVWRVNVDMFHETLRAYILGRLVLERYGHRVQSAGSMVTAALKYLAQRRHAEKQSDELSFDAASIVRHLPKPVLQLLEKKRQAAIATTNKNVSVLSQVAKALLQLSKYKTPACVMEVETGAKPEDSKFEVCVSRMVGYLQQRIANQMILDHYGEVAARVVNILVKTGHLESDSLAEAAMVPAKDVREILHRLYRSRYIDLFTLNQTRAHNPASMIYLWTVSNRKMLQVVTDNVCKALLNLRLRRQHQVEIGKNWIERAQEAGDMDENDHEADKLNHRKFCLGLERLYSSCLQLDETLMVLEDF